jgi:lipopolysaccharide transport system permease protein
MGIYFQDLWISELRATSDPVFQLSLRRVSRAPRRVRAEVVPQHYWREIKPPERGLPPLDLRELWEYRDLGLTLALRDLQLTYRQTLLGVAWVLLQPLAATVIFAVVFGRLAKLPSDGVPYTSFALAGLTVWTFVSTGVSTAATSLVQDRDLVTKVWFPRMLAPLAAVLSASVELLITLLLLIPVLAVDHVVPPLQVLTLPLWIFGATLLATGVGLWLAAANVLYRDVHVVLGFLLQAWLWISPVAISSSLVPGRWRYVYNLNPAAGLIDGMRWALLDGPSPGPQLAVSVVSLIVILVSGAVWFRTAERVFADTI